MKKLFILGVSFGLITSIYGEELPTQKKDKKKQEWMKDQNDQTDTYAVPLDDSEVEEEQEEKELQKEAEKYQERHKKEDAKPQDKSEQETRPAIQS